MRRTTFAVLLLALLAAAPARAAGDPLAAAKAAASSGDVVKAAGLFGDALAATHKEGDLVDEQAAAEPFVAFLARVARERKVRGGTGTTTPGGGAAAEAPAPGLREALAAALARLDPKRCGAFVSAPLLAGDLLLLATLEGDGAHVDAAAAVLDPHGKGKGGRALATLARYAAGLKALKAGEADKAEAALAEALATAAGEGWLDLAAGTSTELAHLRWKAGRNADAAAALEAAAPLGVTGAEHDQLEYFRGAVGKRLAGAPAEVLAPLVARGIIASEGSMTSVGASGGAGGAGGTGMDAGAVESPLGKSLRKFPAGRMLASVSRRKEGLEFRVGWDASFKSLRPNGGAARHLGEGGLLVVLHGQAAGLRFLDPSGNQGQPGESSNADPGRALYRLGRGETWTLAKDGSVTVGGK